MTDCMVNGSRCTACCRAISIGPSRTALTKTLSIDAGFILENWKPMSWRRAKKKNPWLGKRYTKKMKRWSKWWHCKRVTADGCSVHQYRPPVCQKYPHYGRTDEDLAKTGPEYHPDCSQWPKINMIEDVA